MQTQPIISGLPNAILNGFNQMFSRPGEQSFIELNRDREVEDIPHEVLETKINSNPRNLEN